MVCGGRGPSVRKLESQKDCDRISQLPDDILVTILCFLSIKETARLSLVSRRWKNLWMKMPKLEFYWSKKVKYMFRSRKFDMCKYVNLVNHVLKLHETTTTSLEKLSIFFPLDSNYSDDIDRWVEFAARKNVKSLELDFGIKTSTHKTSYDGFLASSAAIKLYWLKDLHLGGVDVDDKAIKLLFSNSPFIERLCVINSSNLCRLEIDCAPNLRYLNLIRCHHLKQLNISAPNLRYLNLIRCHYLKQLNISAPNLTTINLPLHYFLICVNIYAPILSHVSFGLYKNSGNYLPGTFYRNRDIFDCLQKLLGQFSHVNKRLSLRVSRDVFFEICKIVDISNRLPELSNLEHLEIKMINTFPACDVFRKLPRSHELSQGHLWPAALVRAAPILHTLSIKLVYDELRPTEEHYNLKWMDENIPQKARALANVGHYSHQHLKLVELVGFTGCEVEVDLVLYLLETAASLEKIVFHVLRYKENQYEELSRQSAGLLKTQIRPEIDVVII